MKIRNAMIGAVLCLTADSTIARPFVSDRVLVMERGKANAKIYQLQTEGENPLSYTDGNSTFTLDETAPPSGTAQSTNGEVTISTGWYSNPDVWSCPFSFTGTDSEANVHTFDGIFTNPSGDYIWYHVIFGLEACVSIDVVLMICKHLLRAAGGR